jgi:flagellar protein FliO/FliZ
MVIYLLKLAVMLPMVAGMAWGSLWLWRRYQPALMHARAKASAQQYGAGLAVVDSISIGATTRIAVVQFGHKNVLVALARSGVVALAECDAMDIKDAGDGC